MKGVDAAWPQGVKTGAFRRTRGPGPPTSVWELLGTGRMRRRQGVLPRRLRVLVRRAVHDLPSGEAVCIRRNITGGAGVSGLEDDAHVDVLALEARREEPVEGVVVTGAEAEGLASAVGRGWSG